METREKMEKISYAPYQVFEPTEVQIDILRAVAGHQGCHIADVVKILLPDRSESSVRSSVRILLSKSYLDGGKSGSEIVLRLTSRGRILMDTAGIR